MIMIYYCTYSSFRVVKYIIFTELIWKKRNPDLNFTIIKTFIQNTHHKLCLGQQNLMDSPQDKCCSNASFPLMRRVFTSRKALCVILQYFVCFC